MTWARVLEDDPPEAPLSIEMQALFARCMGNEEFAGALLEELEGSCVSQLAAIQSQLRDSNYSAIGRIAHSLKGAAAILSAEPIRELAEQVELACKTSRQATVSHLVERLRAEIDRCLAEIPLVRQRFHELAQQTIPE